MSDSILSVKELRTSFSTDNGEVMAVNGISFDLDVYKRQVCLCCTADSSQASCLAFLHQYQNCQCNTNYNKKHR